MTAWCISAGDVRYSSGVSQALLRPTIIRRTKGDEHAKRVVELEQIAPLWNHQDCSDLCTSARLLLSLASPELFLGMDPDVHAKAPFGLVSIRMPIRLV